MASIAELNAGANALKVYVEQVMTAAGQAWEEGFIPHEFYTTGCKDIIDAADKGTQTPASRQANAEIALRHALQSSGYSAQVPDAEVSVACEVVLKAIGAMRATAERDR